MQIGKGDLKLSLFAYYMILYIRDPKNSTRKRLEMMDNFSKLTGYRDSVYKSIAFPQAATNKHTERDVMETFPFTLASRKIRDLE